MPILENNRQQIGKKWKWKKINSTSFTDWHCKKSNFYQFLWIVDFLFYFFYTKWSHFKMKINILGLKKRSFDAFWWIIVKFLYIIVKFLVSTVLQSCQNKCCRLLIGTNLLYNRKYVFDYFLFCVDRQFYFG